MAASGSVLTMDRALRNLVELAGVALPDAVAMLTRNPALSAGAGERKGLLRPGTDADLLLYSPDLVLGAAICRGRLAWSTNEWRARLGTIPAV
jgi:N-acetylglucosamine-6-phosphate deacetylase